jgi:hypothetical protein
LHSEHHEPHGQHRNQPATYARKPDTQAHNTRKLRAVPGQAIALLRDAVTVLEARAELLAAAGKRTWEISPDMPALAIIIDEYAELKDEAPDAMSDADVSIRKCCDGGRGGSRGRRLRHAGRGA